MLIINKTIIIGLTKELTGSFAKWVPNVKQFELKMEKRCVHELKELAMPNISVLLKVI